MRASNLHTPISPSRDSRYAQSASRVNFITRGKIPRATSSVPGGLHKDGIVQKADASLSTGDASPTFAALFVLLSDRRIGLWRCYGAG